MADDLTAYATYWAWFIAALVFAGLETLVPGASFIWLAGAAAATGVLTLSFGLAWQLQLVSFAVLAAVAVLWGRAYLRRNPIGSADSRLNNRGARMLGQIVTVCEPIVGGEGKVLVGDSPWIASGPDAPVGTRVRILQVEGTRLRVEPE